MVGNVRIRNVHAIRKQRSENCHAIVTGGERDDQETVI
jgi:hypothetical protein